jgi:hypothetical protein
MALHDADVDALEQPVQLLHRQRRHGVGGWPDEAVLLKALVTPFGMQTFPALRRTLSASPTRSTRSAGGNSTA